MSTPLLPNVWLARTVAEASSKACYICYKPSTTVLITTDNKDFFYVCKSHLKDKGFASPIIDEKAEAEKRKKEAMDKEIAKVKAEYEEKIRAKKSKKKSKDEEKDKKVDDDADKAEKERDDKIKALEADSKTTEPTNDEPRVFALQKNFYQMRLDRLRNAELHRRNAARMKDPSFFPSAPSGDIS